MSTDKGKPYRIRYSERGDKTWKVTNEQGFFIDSAQEVAQRNTQQNVSLISCVLVICLCFCPFRHVYTKHLCVYFSVYVYKDNKSLHLGMYLI